MNKLLYIGILLGVLLVSCDKNTLPPSTTGDVVFALEGTLGNAPFMFEAGKNDIYLYTDAVLGNDNIYQYTGEFSKAPQCTTDCEESLKFTIRDYKRNDGITPINTDSSFFIGNYTYQPPMSDTSNTSNIVEVEFTISSNNPSGTSVLLFDFGNGAVSTLLNSNTFTHTYNLDSLPAGLQPLVCLLAFDNSGCVTNYCTVLDFNTFQSGCTVDFTYSPISPQNNVFLFESQVIGGTPPYNLLWDLDGAIISNVDSFAIPVQFDSIANQMCLTVTDAQGCFATVCKDITPFNFASCSNSFSYQIINTPQPVDTSYFSNVVIEYTSPDGVYYSSKLDEQPSSSTFEITSIEEFELNENGQPTKKVTATLDVVLFDESGNSIQLVANNVVFGVAYL